MIVRPAQWRVRKSRRGLVVVSYKKVKFEFPPICKEELDLMTMMVNAQLASWEDSVRKLQAGESLPYS